MWQPNYDEAVNAVQDATGLKDKNFPWLYYRNVAQMTLHASGALSEINRLTALLAMKDETIKTLRERVLQDTATSEDDYDSGYRAA